MITTIAIIALVIVFLSVAIRILNEYELSLIHISEPTRLC